MPLNFLSYTLRTSFASSKELLIHKASIDHYFHTCCLYVLKSVPNVIKTRDLNLISIIPFARITFPSVAINILLKFVFWRTDGQMRMHKNVRLVKWIIDDPCFVSSSHFTREKRFFQQQLQLSQKKVWQLWLLFVYFLSVLTSVRPSERATVRYEEENFKHAFLL